jgi:hypothetical protein
MPKECYAIKTYINEGDDFVVSFLRRDTPEVEQLHIFESTNERFWPEENSSHQ